MAVPDMPVLGCYNFAAFDMATKFAWVNGQPGMTVAQQTSDGLTTLATTLDTTRQSTDRGVGELGASWTGRAGDAARTSLATTAGGITDTATVVRNGADRMADHGRSFEAMRRQITYKDPDDHTWFARAVDNGSEAWHSLWGRGDDHVTIAEHNQANDEVANRALARYQSETFETDSRFTTATAPAGVSPGQGAGPGSEGSAAGGGDRGGGGSGGVAGSGGGSGLGGAGGGTAGGGPSGPVPGPGASGGPSPVGIAPVPAPRGPGRATTGTTPPGSHGPGGSPDRTTPSGHVPGSSQYLTRLPRTSGGDLGTDRSPSPSDRVFPGPVPTVTGPDAARARDERAARFAEEARRHQLPTGPRGGVPVVGRGSGGGLAEPHPPAAGRPGGGSGGGWGTEPRGPGARGGFGEAHPLRTADPGAPRATTGAGGYGPMAGGVGGARDGQDHRNRYVVPTDEVFAVEITATDAVLGPEEDPR
jgi:hypothetical protein